MPGQLAGAISGATVTPLPRRSGRRKVAHEKGAATSTNLRRHIHLGLPAGTYERTAELTGFTLISAPSHCGVLPRVTRRFYFPLALAPRTPTHQHPSGAGCRCSASTKHWRSAAVRWTRGSANRGGGREVRNPRRANPGRGRSGLESAEAGDTAARLLLPRASPPKVPPKRSRSTATWRASIAG